MGSELQSWLASGLGATANEQGEACWRPAADIYQTADGWLIKFDLAGVAPDEVQIALRGRSLCVTGARRDWAVAECCHAYSMEINYSRFSRTVELPTELPRTEIRTQYRDGMLLVRLVTERGKP